MKALAIAATNLRRLFRERANVFFLFVLPMLIILLLGAAFGSGNARLGLVAPSQGRLAVRLVAALDRTPNLELRRFATESELEEAVERGRVPSGLVIPADYDAQLRAGRTVSLRYFGRPDSVAQELRPSVESAVAAESGLVRAARLLERQHLASFERGLAEASLVAAFVPPVELRVVDPDDKAYPAAGGRFDTGASAQLLLFVFLTSLTGATALIETRRLGISRRMLSTPTPVASIVLGEALGRFGVAVVQAAIIAGGSALFFGVDWGDPRAAALLVLVFCLVGSAAGMLVGSTFSNEQQTAAVSLLLGLGLAALGGSMVPIEVFPPGMRLVAHATPHAWANEAFSELLRRGGGTADIIPQLAVLAAFAAAGLTVATRRLRRALTA